MAEPPTHPTPAIIAISSFVARGGVGLRATGFALERLGHRVWMVPTIFLPWHLGHGESTRIVPPIKAFRAALRELAEAPWLPEVGAILTGFLGDPRQAEAIAEFIDVVRKRHPHVLVQADPIAGDNGELYVSEATLEALKTHIVPRADLLTPNRTEIGLLTGTTPQSLDDYVAAARSLAPNEVVVTSMPVETPGRIGTLLVDHQRVILAEHDFFPGAPHGVGDTFGALFLHWRLAGVGDRQALYRATGATCEIIAETVAAGSDEMLFAEHQHRFARPAMSVSIRQLSTAPTGGASDKVMGVDGCAAGWVAVLIGREPPFSPEMVVAETFETLLAHQAEPSVIAVDMPIGLPETTDGPGRAAEQAARPLLGRRQSSVFSIPGRAAVMAETYGEACERALATSNPPKKVSRQAFSIFPKIREIDALMTPELADRVYEVHPEFAFRALNGGKPIASPKKVKGRANPEGLTERLTVLLAAGYPAAFFEQARPKGVGLDDLIDAAASALIARRIAAGEARPYPDPPGTDARGLPIAIWA